MKKESQLTNFVVYDLETFHKNRATPCCISLYLLSKIAGKYNRDLKDEKYQICKKTNVFDGTNYIDKMLGWLVTLKGGPRKVKDKIVENELQLKAHYGSAFDTL